MKKQSKNDNNREITIKTIGFFTNGNPNMAIKAKPYIDYFKYKCALEYFTSFHQSQSKDGTLEIIKVGVPTEKIEDFKKDLSKIDVYFVYEGTLYGPMSPTITISNEGRSMK